MIFYLLAAFPLIVFAFAALNIGTIFSTVVSCLFSFTLILAVWGSHASDLADIFAQDEIIEVYEGEVAQLNKRLSDFEYPKGALMNSDTPIASIVSEISVWQSRLAEARSAKALAKKSIEARRYGIFSGVIGLVGDYK